MTEFSTVRYQEVAMAQARAESDVSRRPAAAPAFAPAQNGSGSEPKLDRILRNLAAHALEETGAFSVAIGLEREGAMICRAVAGLPLADLGAPINTESGLTGMAVRLHMSQWCTDTESDARVDAEVCRWFGLRSIIVVPVRSGDTVIGIFAIFSENPDAFSLGDLNTVKKLSHWAAEAVETTGNAAPQTIASPIAGPDYPGETQRGGGDGEREQEQAKGIKNYVVRMRRGTGLALNALMGVFRGRSESNPTSSSGPRDG